MSAAIRKKLIKSITPEQYHKLPANEVCDLIMQATPANLFGLALALTDERADRQQEIIAGLEQRLATLERKLNDVSIKSMHPALDYKGPWKPAETYLKNEAVSWQGSLWIAEKKTSLKPPGNGWKLAVKKGDA